MQLCRSRTVRTLRSEHLRRYRFVLQFLCMAHLQCLASGLISRYQTFLQSVNKRIEGAGQELAA